MRREDPKYVEKRKKFMAMQKEKSQDKFSKGGLKGNQKKLDKNNNNRIDAQDFKILKAEKAKGRGMGLQDEKVQPGKVMKAKRGDFMERRKQLMGINSVMPKVGSGPKAGRSALRMLKGPAKAGAILGAALTVPVGKMLKKIQDKRKAKNRDEAKVKKMGGGMMNKPMGYDKGGDSSFQKQIEKAKEFRKKSKQRKGFELKYPGPARPGNPVEVYEVKKGSMMNKPMSYSKGGGYDAGVPGKVRDVVNNYTRVGSRLVGERLTKRDMDMLKELGTKKISKMFKSKKFMGGGMIGASQMPRYSKGTMVMARGCKLGRKKATKIT